MRTSLLMALAGLVLLSACEQEDNDLDKDGFEADVDCNDLDATIGEERIWYLDEDGDGWGDEGQTRVSCEAPAGYVLRRGDCDLQDPSVSPSAVESCNSIDDDCDGFVDEGADQGTWYADVDGDGFGDPESPRLACDGTGGLVTNARDCDDASADIRPGADELCDGIDNDCDARVDEADAVDAISWFSDGDGDGYGRTSSETRACAAPGPRWADAGNDCDDGSVDIHPGMDERCDGFDNNCDGLIDDDSAVDATTWYTDHDGDGYGAEDGAIRSCRQVEGTTVVGGDCDDRDRFRTPDTLWFMDDDGDGYGNPAVTTASCEDPTDGSTTWLLDPSDCDDANVDVNPTASEVCDGVDNDCDGVADGADAADATRFYMDFDGDGFGSPERVGRACSMPDGFTTDSSDCDDDNGAVYPGAAEFCDDIDNDCDALVDYADPDVTSLTWYEDVDEDGFGKTTVTRYSCEQPEGFVIDDGDCDDDNEDVNPDAEEVCDAGLDNNCNGVADKDDPTFSGADGMWFRDSDGDDFGDNDVFVVTCSEPTGYVRNDNDCDDADPDKAAPLDCWSGQRVFSTCSTSGAEGPLESACDSAYSGTTLDGEVEIDVTGFQEWVVPFDATFRIEAWGAGGNKTNYSYYTTGKSKGARVRGDIYLEEGDVLYIAVGQEGTAGYYGSGGGGGSWVVLEDEEPLVVAGGGGGVYYYEGYYSSGRGGCNGVADEYGLKGTRTTNTSCTTKTTGLGEGGTTANYGAGGGGWGGNGAIDIYSATGGDGWSDGLIGGEYTRSGDTYNGAGGFGGGGGAYLGGGAGGGYTGGDGGYRGGGGGSYNAGTDTSETDGATTGHGKVTIDLVE